MKKILVLTDFSEASRHALSFARSFFNDTLAEFHLLKIHPAQSEEFKGPEHTVESARVAGENQLHVLVNEFRRQATNDWHTFHYASLAGNPLEVVEQKVEDEAYDFVVIGPQQNDVYGLFGNSAIGLVHALKANVLVVPTDAQLRPIYQIVLAIDFASLKNSKLLSPLKELVTLKGALLTLLSIETPGKKIIYPEQELHIRQFLNPIKPNVAHGQASTPKEGIDAYLAEHPVDLLVTIPRFKGTANPLPEHDHAQPLAYTPLVPLLTLYDDGDNDLPESMDNLSTVNASGKVRV